MGSVIGLSRAAFGERAAWIVPTYRNGRPLWRAAENAVADLKREGLAVVNRAERTIEFPRTGGALGIFSADSPDSIRGESFHLAVVDEAARVSVETWEDVIQPTLADYGGDALLISTPKGLNWFYAEHQRGLSDMRTQASFTAPSSANPNPQIKRAAELARDRVPARTYSQEWLAEFVTDGTYFTNIDACATVTKPDTPGDHQGHTIVAGLDWGLTDDYTVMTMICKECSRVVDWYRTSGGSYIAQRARVVALYKHWGAQSILPERNSIGQPNIEMLRAEELSIMIGPDNDYGWFMSSTNKPGLIESLALSIQKAELRFPKLYAEELRPFEVKTKATGYPEYSAPAGLHDDCVISLALAWRAATFGAQIW